MIIMMMIIIIIIIIILVIMIMIYSASQNKQNPETKGCCDKVPGCMTIIIYIS